MTPRILALIWLVSLAAAVSHADPDRSAAAQKHIAAGDGAFQRGDYDRALREFRLARDSSSNSPVAYRMAQCYERLNKPEMALEFYRSYRTTLPEGAQDREEVDQRIAALEKALPPRRPTGSGVPNTNVQGHIDAGDAAFQRAEYKHAFREYQAAFEVENSAKGTSNARVSSLVGYKLAQCYEKLNIRDYALSHYRLYRDSLPESSPQRAEIARHITELEKLPSQEKKDEHSSRLPVRQGIAAKQPADPAGGSADRGNFLAAGAFSQHYEFPDALHATGSPTVEVFSNGKSSAEEIRRNFEGSYKSATVFLRDKYGYDITDTIWTKKLHVRVLTIAQLNDPKNFGGTQAACMNGPSDPGCTDGCYIGRTFYTRGAQDVYLYVAWNTLSGDYSYASILAHEALHFFLYRSGYHYEEGMDEPKEHRIVSAFLKWFKQQPGNPIARNTVAAE